MDNNNCSVSFPDFTRGYWNLVDGYKHAWASPADEAAAEAAAEAYTEAQKIAVKKLNLWALYDAAKAGDDAAKAAYATAAAQLDAEIVTAEKATAAAKAAAEKAYTEAYEAVEAAQK
jgi:hypothetical protein